MRRSLNWLGLCVALTLPFGLTACSDDDSPGQCGNGILDGSEDCDLDQLGGASCSSLGLGGGNLACANDCTYDTSACQGVVDCGNSQIDSGEQCEGSDLDGETCASLGLGSGTLACDDVTCQFDTTGCEGGVCGNGSIEGTEECDTFELNSATCVSRGYAGGDLDCNTNCTFDETACYGEATVPIGDPCLTNDQCGDGVCWEEAGIYHWGPPSGYCFEGCDENGLCPGSGADGICVTYGTSEFCMKSCDPAASPTECRPGYDCQDLGNGEGACIWGSCTADSQCTVTGDCEDDPNADNFGVCVSPVENCANGADDDFDGDVDCADSECVGTDPCPSGETCGNGSDDDGDGLSDCADPECATLGICNGEECTPPSGANLSCGDSLTGEANDAAGSTNVIDNADCSDPQDPEYVAMFSNEIGPEYAYNFSVTSPQLVTVTVSNYTGDLDIYIIKEVFGSCDTHRGCFAFGGEMAGVDEVITFAAYPGMNYYVVVDGYEGNVSSYDIDVACASTGYENCTNDTDDDGDGLADCDDPECWGTSGCDVETNCVNGEDDDLDGYVDCADSDCSSELACQTGEGYWELFERAGAAFDLVDQRLTFTVDGGNAQGYTWAIAADSNWIDAPGTGSATSVALTIADSANQSVTLPWSFPFQGTNRAMVYVSDDGYLAFTNESGHYPGPSGWNLYSAPRIAPLWGDLDPATAGASIRYDAFADRVVFTWQGLKTKGATSGIANNFQVVLYQNGNIAMSWLDVDTVANLPAGIAGYAVMVGANVGTPPTETNFN